MSLVNRRAVSDTLNVLMQNWMQNSHAAITRPKSGRGVTWDAFWTMCPIHKGWGREEGLVGIPKKCLALSTETCAILPQPNGGLLFWTSRQGMKSHRSGLQPQLEGGHSAARGKPWCLNSAGQQQCLCLQGFPLRCHCSPCAVNKAALLPGWAVPPLLKGRSSTCSPSWLKPLVWHCHPEPLCKYQNYSKAPLWSLLNSQVKKVFWKLLLSSSH